jgi:hypothetical protein
MNKFQVPAIIENRTLVIKRPDLWRQKLAKLEGKEVWIDIDVKKDKRSINQNNYYWGVVVELISDHTGYEPDEVHEFLKDKFIKPKEIVIGNENRNVTTSTTKLTPEHFCKFIEVIQRWATKSLNVYIPNPNEYLE